MGRKERERAAAGMIFREGRLWKKEEWENRNIVPAPEPEPQSPDEEYARIHIVPGPSREAIESLMERHNSPIVVITRHGLRQM